ncbi:hypothetical protein G3570_14725 [Balneolaceae bacterium YR4-1]|uniref:Uncharacterized protein n=1 Tax=Halalkalibaculum roseum TaxID=2709311 RepID=A0A6M1SXT1_9BACT|nr:hypothetical protein [Halalkalibaculum roseum]NGP77900.1 hypothetical protein [Halalkalibaculum roseum]
MDLTARPVSNYRAVLREIRTFITDHREAFYDVSCCHSKLSKRLQNLSSQLETVIDNIPYYDLMASHLEHKFPPRKEINKICGYLDAIACQMGSEQRDTILIYDLNLEIMRFFKENSSLDETSFQ